MMKHFKRSPRHYLRALNFPEPPTPAMIVGQAFHNLVLEEESFKDEFAICPQCDKRTTLGKNICAEFQTTLKSGQIELRQEDFDLISKMRDALMKDKLARELLDALQWVEKKYEWIDDVTGIEMKGKMDGGETNFTIDLKSCIDADPFVFSDVAYRNYLTQPAIYMDGRGLSGENKGDFYFVCVEKEEPFGVSVLKCSDDFIRQGRFAYCQILEDFAHWKEMGSPDVGYEWKTPRGYHELHVPHWAK